jgi:hypothetical protein
VSDHIRVPGEARPVDRLLVTSRSEARRIARRADLYVKINAQRRWIAEHGGDRAGYIERYGLPRSPGCHLPRWTDPGEGCQHPVHDTVYGDGGQAIWDADHGELVKLEREYAELMAESRRAGAL